MRRIFLFLGVSFLLFSCSNVGSKKEAVIAESLSTNPQSIGLPVSIEFTSGKSFYHPLIVFWVEDNDGKYISTLYASKSIATGIFRYGVNKEGKWTPGERRRPAALPYWSHKRGVKASDGLLIPSADSPLPDAITGATPQGNFVLSTAVPKGCATLRFFMEVNQTWDWNEYWHNSKFPNDEEYKTSCQPAVVYSVEVDLSKGAGIYQFKPIGHSHPSGVTGELFPDLSTLTTALEIASKVTVTVP